MFKNFLKIAIRNIVRHKGYSIINIAGLAVGLALFILVSLYADHESGYDRFHKNGDRIFALMEEFFSDNEGARHTGRIPASILPALLNEFPEIEDGTRIVSTHKRIFQYKDKKFFEKRAFFVDANFLTLFSFGMIAGNPKTALTEPLSIVLTESMAHKYFAEENPVGQVLTLDNNFSLKVTGVTEDAPSNSGFQYNCLISMSDLKFRNDPKTGTWTFLLLEKKANRANLEQKFPAFITKHMGNSPTSPKRMYLFPLFDLRFKSHHIQGYWWVGFEILVYIVLGIGVLLLLVVCFNYMNLSIARNMGRCRETGMRKVCGASRGRLMLHYSGESILIALAAFPLALMIFEIIRPAFNSFLSKGPFVYDLSIWSNPVLLVKVLFVTVLVGLAAGSYPAFVLSGLKPIQALRESFQTGGKRQPVRKILVVSQFAGSIILLVLAIVFFKQYDLLYNADTGFNRDRVVVVPMDNNDARSAFQPMKAELLKHPGIVSVFSASGVPGNWNAYARVIPGDAADKNAWRMNICNINYDFIESLEMEMVRGRCFSRDFADRGKYIISQTAARQLRWKNPIGKQLTIGKRTGEVVGVVKDFHFKHLFFTISPAVMCLEPDHFNYMFIKLSRPVSRVTGYIKDRWDAFVPSLPFEYSTLEDYFDIEYLVLKSVGIMVGFIGIIAVLFSCLGMLGLVAYTIRKRTKEIGIRKVHGATVPRIIRSLLWEFLRLVVTANLVAWAPAYLAVNSLTQSGYAYKPGIGISIYIFVGVITLAAALMGITYQTHKAAAANPVEALRYE